jgi:hypothetical protein
MRSDEDEAKTPSNLLRLLCLTGWAKKKEQSAKSEANEFGFFPVAYRLLSVA